MDPAQAKKPIGAVPLALSSAAVYLAVAGTVAYLTFTPATPAPAASAPSSTADAAPPVPAITTTPSQTTTIVSTTTTTATTTATSANLPPDLQRIAAPGGLTTAIPATWAVTPGTVATTLVATDPAAPRREVRLGGAPVTDPAKPLLDRITEAATDREREPGHHRVTLTATTIRSHPAVTWEFDENTPSGPKKVATAFWETNGVEYVLYSAGPPEEWELTRSRLARMVELASP